MPNTSNFKLSDLAPHDEELRQSEFIQDWRQAGDPKRPEEMGLSHYMNHRVLTDNFKFPYSPTPDVAEARPMMHTGKIEKNGNNISLAGIGTLLAYFLAKEYNAKHKDSKLAPFASATDHGTPIQGLTWKW